MLQIKNAPKEGQIWWQYASIYAQKDKTIEVILIKKDGRIIDQITVSKEEFEQQFESSPKIQGYYYHKAKIIKVTDKIVGYAIIDKQGDEISDRKRKQIDTFTQEFFLPEQNNQET